ncbi:MAG TPA: hypothetical protein VNY33_00570 [Gaiellaceae bacterium]|nr:hypothetical protein [Gaiellaceae bacterium]
MIAAAALPVGVAVAHQTAGVSLVDAAYAIPVAAALGVSAVLFARGSTGRMRRTLQRAGGAGRTRLGRILGFAGICMALSGSIAIGFYELLLRLEH